MELIIPIETGGKPLYEQIYEYIKSEISDLRLGAGERLPSTRALSASMNLSRSTVQAAYEQLEAEGYIEARKSKGYYVCELEGILNIKHTESTKASPEKREKKLQTDFSPRGTDLRAFPFGVFRRLAREVYADGGEDVFSSGSRNGERELREAVAEYIHQARGVNADASRIIIGAGSDYLFMLLSIILGRDIKLAMERPTYSQAGRVFASMGAELIDIDMDDKGMRAEMLAASDAGIAYIMPAHQYPMGIIMPLARRQELLLWAEERDGYIIEDDYDSEFRYRGRPIPAMQGMDRDGRVIYIGTFSKSIAPAMRFSFMLLPGRLMKLYEERAGFYACTVPRAVQRILLGFIKRGHMERHLNRMRSLYKSKHELLISELADFQRSFEIIGAGAGLHILLKSRTGIPDTELKRSAGHAGVRVYPVSEFFEDAEKCNIRSTVILGFAALNEEEIIKGIADLKKAWKI